MIAVAIAAVAIGVVVAALIDRAERERWQAERTAVEHRLHVTSWGLEDEGEWGWPR